MNSVGLSDSHASFRRKLSKREKKQLKKQEKVSRLRNENGDVNDQKDGVAEKLYTGNLLSLHFPRFPKTKKIDLTFQVNGVFFQNYLRRFLRDQFPILKQS